MEAVIREIERDFRIEHLVEQVLFPVHADKVLIVAIQFTLVDGGIDVGHVRPEPGGCPAEHFAVLEIERKPEHAEMRTVELRLGADAAKAQVRPGVQERIVLCGEHVAHEFNVLVLHTGSNRVVYRRVGVAKAPRSHGTDKPEIRVLRKEQEVLAVPAGAFEEQERRQVVILRNLVRRHQG